MQPQNPPPPPEPVPPAPAPTPPAPQTEPEPPVSPAPSPPPAEPTQAEEVKDADTELLEPGEHIVTIVHRHPIGIIIFYVEALIGIITIIVLTVVLAPSFFNSLSGQAYRAFLVGIILAISILALILFVATYLYRQSRLIVSDQSLIQIIQKGLFVRKISRLSMSNVQDVTAAHVGFLATIFGFGTLTIETAGEEDNFIFPWCPDPDRYAERILEARQKYVQSLDQGEKASQPG